MTYVNPGSCIAVSVVSIVLGGIAVAARYYVRINMKKGSVGIDDWLCVPALLLTIACAIDIIIGVGRHAVGQHTDPNTSAVVEEAESKAMVALFQMFYVFLILQTLALGCVKLSIMFFYRRVFVGRVFNIISWTVIGVVVSWTIAFFFANVFACGTHPSNFWGTITVINTKCVKTRNLAVGFAMSDAIVDVAIILIPPFWLWQLQMQLRQKIFLLLVFLVGLLAVAASICRCVVFAEAVFRPYLSPGTIFGDQSRDILGIISTGVFWAMVELGVALIVCCFPSLRPLIFTKSFDSLFRSSAVRSSIHSKSASENNIVPQIGEIGEKHNSTQFVRLQSVSTDRTARSDLEKEDRKYGYHFSDSNERV